MYQYLKHLLVRNKVQRQFGFYSDYRGCVLDLLTLSLNGTHQAHIKSVPTSASPERLAFEPQLKARVSHVIHSDWDRGVGPHTCRDELLNEIAAKKVSQQTTISKSHDIAA